MATKEENNNLTLPQVEALIIDIVGKVYSRLNSETSNEINGAIKANINPLTQSVADISKQLEVLSTKVTSTESSLSEIYTALQLPDDDVTQPVTQQVIGFEDILAKARAE